VGGANASPVGRNGRLSGQAIRLQAGESPGGRVAIAWKEATLARLHDAIAAWETASARGNAEFALERIAVGVQARAIGSRDGTIRAPVRTSDLRSGALKCGTLPARLKAVVSRREGVSFRLGKTAYVLGDFSIGPEVSPSRLRGFLVGAEVRPSRHEEPSIPAPESGECPPGRTVVSSLKDTLSRLQASGPGVPPTSPQ
jgi:hypothetical protein